MADWQHLFPVSSIPSRTHQKMHEKSLSSEPIYSEPEYSQRGLELAECANLYSRGIIHGGLRPPSSYHGKQSICLNSSFIIFTIVRVTFEVRYSATSCVRNIVTLRRWLCSEKKILPVDFFSTKKYTVQTSNCDYIRAKNQARPYYG